MRARRFVAFLAPAGLALVLAGCQHDGERRRPEDPRTPTSDEVQSAELHRTQFEDIPVPQGFTYVTRGNRSFSYGQGGVRVARFQYWGPMAPEEVTDFYKRTMGLRAFDWQFISESSPGPRVVALDFRKGRQSCKVTINAESGATYITVDVAGSA